MDYLELLKKQGNFNQYGTVKSQLNILQKYSGARLKFSDLSQEYLEDLIISLKKKSKKGFQRSTRTVTDYLILVKTLYNRAISQKLISNEKYPFGRNKVRLKLTQSLKIPLSKQDIEKLEITQRNDTSEGRWNARCAFLFSYYNAGMRVRDVITLPIHTIIDGLMPYRMSKNEKTQYIELHPKALKIVHYYLDNHNTGKYLFPYMDARCVTDEFDRQRRIKSINRTINNRLVDLAKQLEINKRISMHVARHSFANHAGDKIPIQLLQILYKHSSINTTIGYQ